MLDYALIHGTKHVLKTAQAGMGDEIELTITSHPRWMKLVRQIVQAFADEAGLDPKNAHAVTLAVGEAIGNVIKHAYNGAADRRFSLACSSNGTGLEVRIEDQGDPFDPLQRETLPPEEIRPGGRGIYLMRTLMDELEYERRGDTNIVRMRKFRDGADSENTRTNC